MGFTYRNPSRSTDPNTAVEGARSIIVAARSYHSEQPDHPGGISARVARYAQDDHYTPLRQALQKVALRLRADGYRAVVLPMKTTWSIAKWRIARVLVGLVRTPIFCFLVLAVFSVWVQS